MASDAFVVDYRDDELDLFDDDADPQVVDPRDRCDSDED